MGTDNAADVMRICPQCGRHNAPQETFCVCGAMLANVDFTYLRPAEADAPVADRAGETEAGKDVQAPAGTVVCPHADCAQPNPPGTLRCLYCNRPLVQPKDEAVAGKQAYLPPALRTRFHVLEILPATGGQAELVRAETPQGEARVVKIYRNGIMPDRDVLRQLEAVPSTHLVTFHGYGETNGVSWEAMEYCTAGSLRNLLDSGPQTPRTIHALVRQMAPLLKELHARGILHRDIKPENILLRNTSPLDIALTDFGASSLKMATQYFTAGMRTTQYAAPEVLTGVLDEKSDWWSLGMVVLEAVMGRHPYEGLSEQVALHQLATRAVEVKTVFDDGLRKLCRGLLLRNPKSRWGANEVMRWLAGDETLAMPEERGEGALVRPYTLVRDECLTRADLALALAHNWEAGKKDLARGVVANWVENELRDFNLARDIHDVMARRDLSNDGRLLRVILSALPGVPPVWQGKLVTQDELARAAMRAFNKDAAALGWLLSIYKEDVLLELGARGNGDMARIATQWQRGVDAYYATWERARTLEEAWRKRPQTGLADVAFLMYVAPIRLTPPSLHITLPDVVLALHVPAYARAASHAVERALARMGDNGIWFAELMAEKTDEGSVSPVVMQRLLPFADDDIRREEAVRRPGGDRFVADALRRIDRQCRLLAVLGRLEEFGEEESLRIREEIGGWAETEVWAKGLEHSSDALHAVVSDMGAVGGDAMIVISALDAHQYNQDKWQIWMAPLRFLFILGIVVAVTRFSLPLGVVLAVAWLAWIARLRARSRGTWERLVDRVAVLADSARELQARVRKAEVKSVD